MHKMIIVNVKSLQEQVRDGTTAEHVYKKEKNQILNTMIFLLLPL